MSRPAPDVLAILDYIADRIADRVLERREREVYTSDDLPRDCRSRRSFAERCRQIPEAEKRGRTWSVPRDAWERFRLARRGAAVAKPGAVVTADASLDAAAARLLNRAGLRIVGR